MEKIKEIYQTYNYDMFNFMQGNRGINQKKIKRMTKRLQALQESGNMPFLVIRVANTLKEGVYNILDGQHTYIVLKSLGMPINFYICPNEGIKEVRAINSDMSNWSIWDYVVSNADTGNQNYKKLLKLKDQYPDFCQKELFVALALNKYRATKTNKKDVIKDGSFNFKNYYQVLKTLDQLSDFKFIKGVKYNNYMFIRAMLYFLSYRGYDHERMVEQLKKYPHFIRGISVQDYINQLLERYNKRYKDHEKLSLYKLQQQYENIINK